MPDQLGHGLCLYDDCPARWLFADWEAENDADAEIGTSYLKRLVAPILDPRGRPSSQIRMIPVARGFKHGKIFLTRGMEVTELLAKYPVGLNEEDQLHVEQWNRNMSNMQLMTSDRTVVDQWVRDFWRQNWRISTCDPEPIGTARLEENGTEDDLPERGAGRGRQPRTIGELQREFTSAVNTLGNELRNYQHQIEINIHDPVADEVKLGLASRMFRLLRHFAADADLWTNELGPHVLRSMIDARIIVGWLIIQDDPEQFQRFKDYGLGKRKLYKLQLEELMDRDDLSSDPDDQYLHKRLHAEFNQDVMEEFVKVDVGGSFSGKNIREMARDAGLGELYSLSYQPLSTEAHGEWSSLVGLDLRHCGNPLHRYHRLGTFGTAPEVFVHLGWVRNAFELAEAAITQIFQSYGVAVGPLFDRCLAQLDAARLDTGPDTGPEPTTG